MSGVKFTLDTYEDLLRARTLPEWHFVSDDTIETDPQHAHLMGVDIAAATIKEIAPAPHLFDYQQWVVDLAIEKRTFAAFLTTGLGKTAIQLEWARRVTAHHGGRTLIVAPLNVVSQTISEAVKFYGDTFTVADVRDKQALVSWLADGAGVAITNYEKIDGTAHALPVHAVVLDESSILKSSMGSRRTSLMKAFSGVPWKLCCSATPAPNDRVEYAEHAYFLGIVRSTREFLARFFVNRDGEWQLKRHGLDSFYRHLASWSVFMIDPKAYRFADHLADMPTLTTEFPPVLATPEQTVVARTYENGDQPSLFGVRAGGITNRSKLMQAGHGFILDPPASFPSNKPGWIADICNVRHAGEQVIVWVTFDREGDQLAARIPNSVHISGKTAQRKRDEHIDLFRAGEGARVLILKPAMFGFGLNLQTCAVQVFSTITDSFERYYQAVRRSWRFGQTKPVTIYVPLTPFDEAMCTNVMSKQATFQADASKQEAIYVAALRPADTTEKRAHNVEPQAEIARTTSEHGSWTMIHGDAIAHMPLMAEDSMDLAVFSPPFANLFTYSSGLADMGNVRSDQEYRLQWKWFAERLIRVMKPGRVVAIHAMDVIRFAGAHGHRYTYDYPSDLRQGMEDAGFHYHARIAIDKNPQIQATRTKDHNLLFVTLTRNALNSHPQASECVLIFRKPGESEVPVIASDVSNQEWITWAHHVWYGIRETDVLNAALAKEAEDERHICLASGSLVLTRDGYLPIEDVTVGADVLTHEGRWQPVLAKRCNGIEPVIRTCAQGVADLRTTSDHKLWTRVGAGAKAKAQATEVDPAWVPASDVLGSYLNVKLPPVEDSSLTADECWIIGRWLGDGHRGSRQRSGKRGGTGQFLISCSHQELSGLLAKLGPHAGHVGNPGTASQVALKELSPAVRTVLARCGKGAVGKRVPAELLALDQDRAEALLSGYLSADGHYVGRYDRWMASSVSRALLLGMALIAQRARGVVASVYAGRPPRKHTIEGRIVEAKQDWIFSFRNSPGYRQSGWIGEDGAWKKVRRSESAGYAEVWDLRVAGDESFTAEGAIVKNCPLQLSLIERCVRLWSNEGETVFSPFAGIGSEGWEALGWGRRFYGIELKESYYQTATRFLSDREVNVSGRLDFA